MSEKDKPDQNKEEHIKLDMSFDDALRLAMKSPPIFSKKLQLSVETELKKVSGRIIEFISLEIDNGHEKPSQFTLLVKIVDTDGSTSEFPLHPNYPMSSLKSSSSKGYFVLFGDTKFTIGNKQRVYLTISSVSNYPSRAKSFIVAYTSATKF